MLSFYCDIHIIAGTLLIAWLIAGAIWSGQRTNQDHLFESSMPSV